MKPKKSLIKMKKKHIIKDTNNGILIMNSFMLGGLSMIVPSDLYVLTFLDLESLCFISWDSPSKDYKFLVFLFGQVKCISHRNQLLLHVWLESSGERESQPLTPSPSTASAPNPRHYAVEWCWGRRG